MYVCMYVCRYVGMQVCRYVDTYLYTYVRVCHTRSYAVDVKYSVQRDLFPSPIAPESNPTPQMTKGTAKRIAYDRTTLTTDSLSP